MPGASSRANRWRDFPAPDWPDFLGAIDSASSPTAATPARLVSWAQDKTHVALEIVRRMPWMKGFVVIRRRWVVERTFAWIMKCRRLVRDYEQLTRVAETLITIAAAATLIRRWP